MDELHQLADEIRETYDDRGWKIEKAIGSDLAFQASRRSQSSLGRDLVIDAVEQSAKRLGITVRSVAGGAIEVVLLVDGTYRHFRIKKASVRPDGGYRVLGKPALMIIDDTEEGESLYGAERWVLSYTTDDDGMVVDIFAAKVIGISSDTVPELELAYITMLGAAGGTPPTGGFKPAEEDDLDFGDDEDEGGAANAV